MHETALAENILSIALETAKKNRATKIFKIGLTLGELAGVEIEALTLAFDVMKKKIASARCRTYYQTHPDQCDLQ